MDNIRVWLMIGAIVAIFAIASWVILTFVKRNGKLFAFIPGAFLMITALGFLVASQLEYGAGSWNDLIFAVFAVIFAIAAILTLLITGLFLFIKSRKQVA